jgi:hypothetical protein
MLVRLHSKTDDEEEISPASPALTPGPSGNYRRLSSLMSTGSIDHVKLNSAAAQLYTKDNLADILAEQKKETRMNTMTVQERRDAVEEEKRLKRENLINRYVRTHDRVW